MVLGKWEYISQQLEILGAPQKVINSANEVDRRLTEAFGDEQTSEWIENVEYIQREDFGVITKFDLRMFAMDGTYCIACEKTRLDECRDCKLSNSYHKDEIKRNEKCGPDFIRVTDWLDVI